MSEFESRAGIWRELNRQLGDSVLLDPLFVRPLLAEFARGDEVLAAAESDGQPIAMAILRRTSPWVWQTFQPANAPLGMVMVAPDVQNGEYELAALLRGLSRSLPAPVLLLGLSQLDPELTRRPDPGPNQAIIDYIDTPRLTISGSYDEYWKSRGKNLRHNISRQRNLLAREGVVARLERLRQPSRMRSAVADYARLESAGWKEEIASAVRPNDRQERFYASMLEGFAEQGEALILRLFFDDRLVATDLCLLRDRTLVILKTTYDESRKSVSPAHLMRHQVIAEAFERGDVARIEFFGPVQDWHLKWTGDVRTLYHLNYYPMSFIKGLHETLRRRRRAVSSSIRLPEAIARGPSDPIPGR